MREGRIADDLAPHAVAGVAIADDGDAAGACRCVQRED
jgi:hypothetical protein